MRGDIIERCLIFLIKLSEIRTSDNFHSILISIIEWGNETLVSLMCLIVVKFSLPCTHVQVRDSYFLLGKHHLNFII